ncbi:DUF5683 domain-containing protein [Flavobacterium orientale]|uniref:DUF5683 domain-containing protein n=1 Tax=Flavobacterium orientale TaxID=1756020 RepID=A0A916XVY8_9FLAO|nr:DUF5683 domain-containing protein [Flavobacterium orientale]GGD15911.1 hypothetical protein GCM10011343_03580 [Flavobacterium orientale]
MRGLIVILFFVFVNQAVFAQKIEIEEVLIAKDSVVYKAIDPLAPSKAAFYSAILPGLGQAYNKKYWKIPIVYGGLATGIYFYADNNKKYNEFRDIYKRRLEGFTDDEYFGIYSDNVIINAQRTFQRNRSISLLVTLGIYVLNIVDANVDAHLIQFNVNNNLSLKPDLRQDDMTYKYNIGLTLNYSFK